MANCEKCWRDSGGDVEEYQRLVLIRNCTPEEQAGEGAEKCPVCNRLAMHIYCHVCMACNYNPNTKGCHADNG